MSINSDNSELKIFATTLTKILIVALLITAVIKIAPIMIDEVFAIHGVTAIAEGTVSNKQYSAAHTDKEGFLLLTYHTNFVPEKWNISIRRYDSKAKKWETAVFETDKATYDQLKIGDQFKDPLGRTTYFAYE